MYTVLVYDRGAVSPTDILRAVDNGHALVIVLAPSAHAQRMRPFFDESCAAVYDLTDDELAGRLGAHPLAGILTFAEPMLPATAQLAAALRLPYHDAAVVKALTSKDEQRRVLRAAGVDQTRATTLTSLAGWPAAAALVGLPAVVKPARSVSSRNTVLIDSLAAGRERLGPLLAEEGVLVVEEYLRGIDVPDPFGDYVSVETVVQGGARHHLAITGKLRLVPPFRECGAFWPARLDATTRADVLALAEAAIKALDVATGVLHTEIKLTPDGPRIIEVNGRVGGYIPELAEHAAGIDLVDVALRIAAGRPVDLPPVDLDRVYYQFTTPAPIEPGVVTKISRRDALADVSGVTRYSSFVRPGDDIGGIRTHDLDLLMGESSDHESLAVTIGEIMDSIVYGFRTAGADIERSARDLVYRTHW